MYDAGKRIHCAFGIKAAKTIKNHFYRKSKQSQKHFGFFFICIYIYMYYFYFYFSGIQINKSSKIFEYGTLTHAYTNTYIFYFTLYGVPA
jgi:hypothetical protein